MIYFTGSDIFYAFFASLVFGNISGILYSVFFLIVRWGRIFLKIPFVVLFSKRTSLYAPKVLNSQNSIATHAFDFLFFVIWGFLYLCLSFSVLDGFFRMYMLLLVLIAFYLAYKTFGRLSIKILNASFDLCYSIVFSVIYIFLFPIRWIIHLSISLALPPIIRFCDYIKVLYSSKLQKSKISDIEKIY